MLWCIPSDSSIAKYTSALNEESLGQIVLKLTDNLDRVSMECGGVKKKAAGDILSLQKMKAKGRDCGDCLFSDLRGQVRKLRLRGKKNPVSTKMSMTHAQSLKQWW